MPEVIVLAFGVLVTTIALTYLIDENGTAVNELNFHRHGSDGLSLPRNSDGELIHTLDGIGGWY
jgi:hypothetical protein